MTSPSQPPEQPRPPAGPPPSGPPSGPSREKGYLASARQRFMAKVVVASNGCWLWDGAIQSRGYGSFGFGGKGKSVLAHRWSYETFVGPIPDGLEVDHVCHSRDNDCTGGICAHRLCVRPDHLEPVTQAVNAQRGVRSRVTHCPQGHAYTAANTILKRGGQRHCRTCQNEANRAWRLRRKQKLAAPP